MIALQNVKIASDRPCKCCGNFAMSGSRPTHNRELFAVHAADNLLIKDIRWPDISNLRIITRRAIVPAWPRLPAKNGFSWCSSRCFGASTGQSWKSACANSRRWRFAPWACCSACQPSGSPPACKKRRCAFPRARSRRWSGWRFPMCCCGMYSWSWA